jgi:hypothetical protein
MASGIALAPAIKAALKKITVKEPALADRRTDHELVGDQQRFLASLAEITLTPSARKGVALCMPPASAPGKFWANDDDSYSDYEDLGDVNEVGKLSSPVIADTNSNGQEATTTPIPRDHQHVPPTGERTTPVKVCGTVDAGTRSDDRKPFTPALAKRSKRSGQSKKTAGIRWPWCMPWKGPLPPPRSLPARTIGDVLRPAMHVAGGVRGTVSTLEPRLPCRDQILNSTDAAVSTLEPRLMHTDRNQHSTGSKVEPHRNQAGNRSGPNGNGPSFRRSGLNCIRQKLAPRVPDTSTNLHAVATNTRDRCTYAQVVMAGGQPPRSSSAGGVRLRTGRGLPIFGS